MLGLVLEFIATMVFTMIVSLTGGDAMKVGIGLAAMVILCSAYKVGHLNPAVSISQFLGSGISLSRMLSLVAMQVGGAVAGHFLLQLRSN